MPACRLLKEALEQLTGTKYAQVRQAFALGGQVMEGDDEGLDDSDSGSVVEEAEPRHPSGVSPLCTSLHIPMLLVAPSCTNCDVSHGLCR